MQMFAVTNGLLRGIGISPLLTPLRRFLVILVCALTRTLERVGRDSITALLRLDGDALTLESEGKGGAGPHAGEVLCRVDGKDIGHDVRDNGGGCTGSTAGVDAHEAEA